MAEIDLKSSTLIFLYVMTCWDLGAGSLSRASRVVVGSGALPRMWGIRSCMKDTTCEQDWKGKMNSGQRKLWDHLDLCYRFMGWWWLRRFRPRGKKKTQINLYQFFKGVGKVKDVWLTGEVRKPAGKVN